MPVNRRRRLSTLACRGVAQRPPPERPDLRDATIRDLSVLGDIVFKKINRGTVFADLQTNVGWPESTDTLYFGLNQHTVVIIASPEGALRIDAESLVRASGEQGAPVRHVQRNRFASKAEAFLFLARMCPDFRPFALESARNSIPDEEHAKLIFWPK